MRICFFECPHYDTKAIISIAFQNPEEMITFRKKYSYTDIIDLYNEYSYQTDVVVFENDNKDLFDSFRSLCMF